METLVFWMVRISLLLILMHMINLEVYATFQTCATNIQTKARSGRDECIMKTSNAADCIRGYDVVVRNIPTLCASDGSGRKKRAK